MISFNVSFDDEFHATFATRDEAQEEALAKAPDGAQMRIETTSDNAALPHRARRWIFDRDEAAWIEQS